MTHFVTKSSTSKPDFLKFNNNHIILLPISALVESNVPEFSRIRNSIFTQKYLFYLSSIISSIQLEKLSIFFSIKRAILLNNYV